MCANTFSCSAAGSLRSRMEEIRSCTWLQLIAHSAVFRRQSQGRPLLQAARELFPQGFAAPQNARLYGPERNAQDIRDLFVAQIRDVSQYHGFAENRVDLEQRGFNHYVLLVIARR